MLRAVFMLQQETSPRFFNMFDMSPQKHNLTIGADFERKSKGSHPTCLCYNGSFGTGGLHEFQVTKSSGSYARGEYVAMTLKQFNKHYRPAP